MKLTRGTREIRRVVITGIGAVTPLGLSMEETWQNLLRGQSGIATITKFDTSAYDTKFAGEVKNFNADAYVSKKDQKKMDTFIQYALAATQMALEDAKLELTEAVKDTTGTMIGVGMGGLPYIEDQFTKIAERGPSRISPFFIPAVITNMASGQVSIAHGFRGTNYSITSACATGAHSIGEAYNAIRYGQNDVMVAGGSEATVCPMAIGGFGAMRALSTRNDDPTHASRPMDKDRDGFVLSEGCAVLIMESMEHAIKRGAKILAEVSGYGSTADAYHMTSPAPGGSGGQRSVMMALKDSGLRPEDIQYVNPHATSTPVGDELETQALKAAFGDHAKKLWVNATKSMIGHTLGAAGAIESAICVHVLLNQISPPTINLASPSECCDLDYVSGEARTGKITHALNNSFGFGGTNASLIFSKVES